MEGEKIGGKGGFDEWSRTNMEAEEEGAEGWTTDEELDMDMYTGSGGFGGGSLLNTMSNSDIDFGQIEFAGHPSDWARTIRQRKDNRRFLLEWPSMSAKLYESFQRHWSAWDLLVPRKKVCLKPTKNTKFPMLTVDFLIVQRSSNIIVFSFHFFLFYLFHFYFYFQVFSTQYGREVEVPVSSVHHVVERHNFGTVSDTTEKNSLLFGELFPDPLQVNISNVPTMSNKTKLMPIRLSLGSHHFSWQKSNSFF